MMPATVNPLLDWLGIRAERSDLRCQGLDWDDCEEWSLTGGRLVRSQGGFFTVMGVEVETPGATWDQPLIDQREVGVLGFLGRRLGDGSTEVLVQAKSEPGNVGRTQIGPTVQATVSNYMRVHGGRPTPYLEHFLAPGSSMVLGDVEQSEQGRVFAAKYNRNVFIVGDTESAEEPDTPTLAWFALRDLVASLDVDFAVNTDARSVLCCSDWRGLTPDGRPFAARNGSNGFGEMLQRSYEQPDAGLRNITLWVNEMRSRRHFQVRPKPLDQMTRWKVETDGLEDQSSGSFVRLYDVEADDREVDRWQQPLVGDANPNTVVLLCQEQAGMLRFLVSAAIEPGFREQVQLGPTAQSLSGPLTDQAFNDFALQAGETVLSVHQSEEGGRFFETINRYQIRLLAGDESPPANADSSWLTLRELHGLARSKGFLTNELRSAVSLLLTRL